MSMLDLLTDPAVWQTFYNCKESAGHMSKKDLTDLCRWIDRRGYLPVAERIRAGIPFPHPCRKELSKLGSDKKRVVYTYPEDENRVLKLLTFLLQGEYDHLFADNLYSFRPRKGVRDAVLHLLHTRGIGEMWSYKADIHNYFNSVPVERLLPMLEHTLEHDPELFRFLSQLLTDPYTLSNGIPVREEKGIMAGTPVSAFLANLYLSHMDHHFQSSGILYARYSDDIILFAPSIEEREHHAAAVANFLAEAGLTVNPSKEVRTAPGEQWTFLGICCKNGTVDVAPISVKKLKAKMRRKTRALARWAARNHVDGTQAAKAFIRIFHRKLFEQGLEHELNWTRWYFPLINTADSLMEIDAYRQRCIRYLATGSNTKSAYWFRYEDMKRLGYVSLVHRYYEILHGASHHRKEDMP